MFGHEAFPHNQYYAMADEFTTVMKRLWTEKNNLDLLQRLHGGDRSSCRQRRTLEWAVGGNPHLVGTPEMVVEWFVRLRQAGVDGVQVNFFDCEPDLDTFSPRFYPLCSKPTCAMQCQGVGVSPSVARMWHGEREVRISPTATEAGLGKEERDSESHDRIHTTPHGYQSD